ncbi:MAG TPA: TonB-dependent receptor [Steroidobacteraceae bacterium]|nr:TonB-dependent receptor [Steroidobacteraceae bacterium]
MKTKFRARHLLPVATLLGSAQLAIAQTPDNSADQNGDLQEVVVVGLRASLEAAQKIKQDADQVVDAIVADDIGKFPDNTVAAALQRVPGIQTVVGFNNEIANPLIRGIGDILTTVDGREMFTGVGRGFAFQDLPAEAIAGANVYKSSSANLIEGGVAGEIDLRLHKPFNFDEGTTAAFNVRGIYPEEVDSLNYTVGALVSHRTENFGILLDASYSDQDFNRPISFNCDPRSGSNGPPGAAGIILPTCVGGLNDYGNYNRPQVNLAVEWKLNDSLEWYGDALYAGYDATFETDFIFSDIFAAQNITNTAVNDHCVTTRVDGGGFLGLPPRDPDPNVPGDLGYPGDAFQDLCFGTQATFNNVPGLTSTQAKTGKTDQTMFATGLRFDTGALHLEGDVSYLESKNKNRNIIVDIGKNISAVNILVDNSKHGTTDMPGNPLGDENGFLFANSLFQDINSADSTLFAVAVNGKYDIGDGFLRQLQFGARYGDRDSTYRANAPGGPGAPGGNRVTLVNSVGLPADFLLSSPATIPFINGGQHWMTPDADYLRDHTDELRAIYGQAAGDPPDDPSRNFDAQEQTLAGYVQAKYGFQAGNTNIDGLLGVRLTKNDRTLSGTGRVTGVLTPVTTDTSETEVLPNLSMRAQFTDKLQARLTAAKTLSQPFFGDLNPGLFYDVPSNANVQPAGAGGNPELKPQKSTAYDATLEYYFSRSSYLSAAIYYRELQDRVSLATNPEVIDGITYNITRPRNVGEAALQGVELSAQVFFDSLPGVWGGFGAFANYTFADSEIKTATDRLNGEPLLGVSENSYNVGLLYEKFGLTGRLVYTWRDEFNEGQFGCLLGRNADDFCGNQESPPAYNVVRAYGRLDMSLGYDVNEKVTVSLEGTNLTGSDYYSYTGVSWFPHDIRVDDRTYGLSVRVRL